MFNRSPVRVWRDRRQDYDLINKAGKLVSWTVVYVGPASFADQAPYIVGLVDFGKKGRRMGQVVGVREADLKVGMKLVGVFRRLRTFGQEGVIEYGVKFRVLPGGRGKSS